MYENYTSQPIRLWQLMSFTYFHDTFSHSVGKVETKSIQVYFCLVLHAWSQIKYLIASIYIIASAYSSKVRRIVRVCKLIIQHCLGPTIRKSKENQRNCKFVPIKWSRGVCFAYLFKQGPKHAMYFKFQYHCQVSDDHSDDHHFLFIDASNPYWTVLEHLWSCMQMQTFHLHCTART